MARTCCSGNGGLESAGGALEPVSLGFDSVRGAGGDPSCTAGRAALSGAAFVAGVAGSLSGTVTSASETGVPTTQLPPTGRRPNPTCTLAVMIPPRLTKRFVMELRDMRK